MKVQNESDISREGKRRIFPLSLLLITISFTVAFGSVFLLVDYVAGISEEQSLIEKLLQAELSEQTAIAELESGFRSGAINDLSSIPLSETGDMVTSFSLLNTSVVPSEQAVYHFEDSDTVFVAVCQRYIFAISEKETNLSVYLLDALEDGDPVLIASFQEWEPDMRCAAGFLFQDEPMLFLPYRIENLNWIIQISGETGIRTYSEELPLWNEYSLVKAGVYRNRPALLISDGYNGAQLFLPDSGQVLFMTSPRGTTPAFYGHGSLLGEESDPAAYSHSQAIRDVFSADCDGDGIDDLVFAGDSTLAIQSTVTGSLFLDSVPGCRLESWIVDEIERTLSARWTRDRGSDTWKEFTGDGFMAVAGPEFASRDWTGRISRMFQSMIGSNDEHIGIVSGAGLTSGDLCSYDQVVFSHLDSHQMDIVCTTGNLLRIFLNPMTDGLFITLNSETYLEHQLLRENSWNVFLHSYGENTRVSLERVM